MSGTRAQWAQLIEQVMRLVYEQDDSYMGMSYDEAKEYIRGVVGHWTIIQLDRYIRENFPAQSGAASRDKTTAASVAFCSDDS